MDYHHFDRAFHRRIIILDGINHEEIQGSAALV